MAHWIEPSKLELQLWYGEVLVADLCDVCPHQGTWFGEYELRIPPGEGSLQNRLIAYIAFCEDFNRRVEEGSDHDFDEFTEFLPISDCSSWTARLRSGDSLPMEGRMWFADGGVSWQHPESEPSTELAANEFWARSAGCLDTE